jgi:hypothetical protein
LLMLNSSRTRSVMQSLNPTVHFQLGDVDRVPIRQIEDSEEILRVILDQSHINEIHRETSVEFRHPGASPWRHAQDWAQAAVDRPEGSALPVYVQELDREQPIDHLSFAFGVALGRFSKDGEGILDPATANSCAGSNGLLFLDNTLDDTDLSDGLGLAAGVTLQDAWDEHGSEVGGGRSLRKWLAFDFFNDVHKVMYENRPIHWPLSSRQRTFVAWVNVHRFTEQTLRVLLADHLNPTLTRLEGELNDLRAARDSADKRAARAAEKLYERKLRARDELKQYMAHVEQCADRGAPPTDNKCPVREQDARYALNLDDGVVINSAALWPLLEPQWKDPKKWWKELSTAKDRKDYDWSHLAMRYWPKRVDEKCQKDPSLGVAHGCFWRYHSARAWKWELRLQDEIGPEFKIVEAPYRPGGQYLGDTGDAAHRVAWLRDHPDEALAAIEQEVVRRMRRGKKREPVAEMRILETGLWTSHAEDIWSMELRLAEKQGSEVRILAPDEPDARATFEKHHPGKVLTRQTLLKNLAPPVDWLEDNKEEAQDGEEDALAEADGGEEGES